MEAQKSASAERIWIVEDDQEIARAVWRYLVERIPMLEVARPLILAGAEEIANIGPLPSCPPLVAIVGTENPYQAIKDIDHVLTAKNCPPVPIIGLGTPETNQQSTILWESWPTEADSGLADRVRTIVFGGPQPSKYP